jgi:2-iminobutanoate/2-iminopropanoate deaminase
VTIRRIRTADGVADPVGPFAHAVVSDGLVFTSGQLPVLADGTVPGQFEQQVEAAISNLRAVLREAGSDLDHVLSVRSFLTDSAQLEPYNRVYVRHFGEHPPARTTVCVALWGVSMEIDCVARVAEADR